MDRRDFMKLGPAFLLALMTADWIACASDEWPENVRELARRFPPGTRRLGALAHDEVFRGETLTRLLARLQAESPPARDPAGWLRAQIRADFRAGRVVEVDRWHLAEIEALVCAAAAAMS
jgi:hypothetical protein